MDALIWVVIVLVVIVVLVLLAISMRRQRRRDHLRERFGPEYDRAMRNADDRSAVQEHLEELAQRRDELEITPLDVASRARYDEQWDAVQARFVDEPGQAVSDADTLVTAVMRDRGYPLEDFDDRAALLATDHPDVVAHYRAAHSAYSKYVRSGRSDTEDLRQAFVSYRALFSALTREAAPAEPAAGAAIAADPAGAIPGAAASVADASVTDDTDDTDDGAPRARHVAQADRETLLPDSVQPGSAGGDRA